MLKDKVQSLFDEGFSEGEMSIDPLWYSLWPIDELEELNEEYALDEFAEGFTAFGSNGGNELLVVDTDGKVYMIPAVGMDAKHAELIAQNIDELKQYMEKNS